MSYFNVFQYFGVHMALGGLDIFVCTNKKMIYYEPDYIGQGLEAVNHGQIFGSIFYLLTDWRSRFHKVLCFTNEVRCGEWQ